MFEKIVKLLGLDRSEYDQWEKKGENFLMHQLRRKIRYSCFAMQRGEPDGVPQNFIDHYEAQPDFSGWELFGDRWDVKKGEPHKTYPRKFSIHEEWDAELRMAVPELAGAISYKQSQ